MDKDGFFRITGRYKELIIGAGGENVAPVPIENWLKSKYTAISNIMMIGDKRKYSLVFWSRCRSLFCVIERFFPLIVSSRVITKRTRGEHRYNTALVTLKTKDATGELPGTDDLDGEALNIVPGVTKVSKAMNHPKYLAYIAEAINAVNANVEVVPSNVAKIQKFRILSRDFSTSTGEFTPTLKLKRGEVMQLWRDVIEEMYAEE